MNSQDTFISHLVELRDRLLRAIIAVLVVFLCLFPWAKDLYTLMAQPLLAVLPQGGQRFAASLVRPSFTAPSGRHRSPWRGRS